MSADLLNASLRPRPNDPSRIIDWATLHGQTIRCAMESFSHPGSQVLITEDDRWAVLACAFNAPDEDGAVQIEGQHGWASKLAITDYLEPAQLLQARLINATQAALLEQQKEEALQRKRAEQAELLRKQADEVAAGRHDWRL